MALYRNRIQDDRWDYFKDLFFFYKAFGLYCEQINHFVDTEVKITKERYEGYLKEIAGDDGFADFEIFDHASEMEAAQNLVDIYYDAFIMSLYSFTERKMYYLCKFLSKDYKVKLEDIAGNGIFKYKKYLSKVCGIDFAYIEKDWSILDDYNKLRNHLVHSEGNRSVNKGNNQLVGALKKFNGVKLSDEDEYINFHFSSDQVAYDFINCVQRILDYLYREKH